MPAELNHARKGTPATTASDRLLRAPTAGDRLAEWRGRIEEGIRQRPVVALVVATTAGLLVGRLARAFLRTWLDDRDPDAPRRRLARSDEE